MLLIGAAQVNWTGFSAWNIEKMLRFAISTLSCPVIILGGGGYDPCTFSSSATFVTNSLVSGTPESIDLQIPEHDFYSHYKKCGFELSLGGTQEKGYHNVHHNVKLNIYHDDQNRRWELTSIDKINKFLF